jgi:hypothetical protein
VYETLSSGLGQEEYEIDLYTVSAIVLSIGILLFLPYYTTVNVRRKREASNDYFGPSGQIYDHLNAALDRFDKELK